MVENPETPLISVKYHSRPKYTKKNLVYTVTLFYLNSTVLKIKLILIA